MTKVSRRHAIQLLASSGALSVACTNKRTPEEVLSSPSATATPGSIDPILKLRPLPRSGTWPTLDPFLFCVHHVDHYPAGNEHAGPAVSLEGRQLGNDFAQKDGFNMYHGRTVPGFPAHPHRGFETVTVVRRGLLDHADSLGAAARYGQGDVQWLTAGAGIQHAEMFPLLDSQRDNPLELFQIWLNLPQKSKMAEPHFTMMWSDAIPAPQLRDPEGKKIELSIRAGKLEAWVAPAPPPNSWAADPENDVAIWTIRMEPGARWTLPAASKTARRALYFFEGTELRVADRRVTGRQQIELQPDVPVTLENGSTESELLLLQGRPIGEPVAQRGPFVMNSSSEIREAYLDYNRTRFGGWPWPDEAPVHGKSPERFARRPDGSIEKPS